MKSVFRMLSLLLVVVVLMFIFIPQLFAQTTIHDDDENCQDAGENPQFHGQGITFPGATSELVLTLDTYDMPATATGVQAEGRLSVDGEPQFPYVSVVLGQDMDQETYNDLDFGSPIGVINQLVAATDPGDDWAGHFVITAE